MKYFYALIFLLLSIGGVAQCEVYITPGSSTVIDHNPGISFVFEIQNDSNTPYSGGDLYLNWALSGGASGPIYTFDFGVFPILPGQSKYVSTPSFDIPLPENVPGNWYSYGGWTGDNYFPPGWALFLDDEPSCWDYVLDDTQVNGYFNNPLSDGCDNPNGDNFCDDQCNLEVIDFNLETAELTVIPNSTYCPNLGSPFWQNQYPFDNPYVFGFQLNFNWGSNQIDISVGGQQIYESGDPIIIDLSDGILSNLAYQNMVESINEGEFCDLAFTLYNINNSGEPMWLAPDNQSIELLNLCPVLDTVNISLDTLLYDIGCEWVFESPDPVPYWIPTYYFTNNGDVPVTEFCVVPDILSTPEIDTLCYNGFNILLWRS